MLTWIGMTAIYWSLNQLMVTFSFCLHEQFHEWQCVLLFAKSAVDKYIDIIYNYIYIYIYYIHM